MRFHGKWRSGTISKQFESRLCRREYDATAAVVVLSSTEYSLARANQVSIRRRRRCHTDGPDEGALRFNDRRRSWQSPEPHKIKSTTAPAIDAGASVLHVVHLEPKLAPLPLGRAPSAFESLERILSATPARLIDADIRYAALRNRIPRAEHLAAEPSAVSRSREEVDQPRQLEIHRYYPRGQIGGMIGLLDFDRGRMAELIELGFREAVEHDCAKNKCVMSEVAAINALSI